MVEEEAAPEAEAAEAAPATPTQIRKGERYYHGTGRRKTAIARVRLYPGSGAITANDRPYLEVFPRVKNQAEVKRPLLLTETLDRFDVHAKVEGGGISAWAGAMGLGIARALIRFDEGLRSTLRRGGLLTRDPRVKEREKYGLKRARKAPQYTKR